MHPDQDDSRKIGEDILHLNLSNNKEAMGLLDGKNAGDKVSLKNVSGRLIKNEDGMIQLQIDEVEFDGGQSGKPADEEESISAPVTSDSDPILVLLNVPEDEERTDGSEQENT